MLELLDSEETKTDAEKLIELRKLIQEGIDRGGSNSLADVEQRLEKTRQKLITMGY